MPGPYAGCVCGHSVERDNEKASYGAGDGSLEYGEEGVLGGVAWGSRIHLCRAHIQATQAVGRCSVSQEGRGQDDVCDPKGTGRGGWDVCEKWRGIAGDKTWHLCEQSHPMQPTERRILKAGWIVGLGSRDNGVSATIIHQRMIRK